MNKTLVTVSTMAALSFLTAPVSAGLFSSKSDKPRVAKINKTPSQEPLREREICLREERKTTDQGHERSADSMPAGYNAPGRYDVQKKWSFFMSASYIYWVPMADDFNIATEIEHATQLAPNPQAGVAGSLIDTPELRTEERGFDVQYKSGFKFAFGVNFNHDNWAMVLQWARLSGEVEDRRHEEFPEFLVPAWVLQDLDGNAANKVEADWDFLFNIVDFGFQRPCYIGTKLILTPYIGGRLFTNHQRLRESAIMNLSVAAPSSRSRFPVTTVSKAETWQIGPRVALDANWLLGKGFRMEGDLGLSIQYAQAIIEHEEDGDIGTANTEIDSIRSKIHTHSARPNMDLGLGFGWGRYVDHGKEHIDFSAKYDFLTFWNANDITKVSTVEEAGNLTLHGLTFSFRLDF